MDALQVVIELIGFFSLGLLVWWVKTHISNRIARHAQQYGEIDAKIERLPDLAKIETALKESQQNVELQFKASIEDVLQRYRVRLATTQKLIEQKLDIYQQLSAQSFDLYRGLAKIAEPQDVPKYAQNQDDYYSFFQKNGLYLSPGVRRAAEMLVAILTDLIAIHLDDGGVARTVHSIRERARVVNDLLHIEIAADLNADQFTVLVPTREQREAWIQESKDVDKLTSELEERSGTPVLVCIR